MATALTLPNEHTHKEPSPGSFRVNYASLVVASTVAISTTVWQYRSLHCDIDHCIAISTTVLQYRSLHAREREREGEREREAERARGITRARGSERERERLKYGLSCGVVFPAGHMHIQNENVLNGHVRRTACE